MAVTVTLYNHTVKKFANNEINVANLKFMLLDAASGSIFDATQTNCSQLAAHEVSGSGWTQDGVALTNAAITTVTTNDAKLDADDISVTASGGAIGPAFSGVLKYDVGSPDVDIPLAFVDFGQSEEAGDTTDFKIVWPANGIITWTYT